MRLLHLTRSIVEKEMSCGYYQLRFTVYIEGEIDFIIVDNLTLYFYECLLIDLPICHKYLFK